MSKSSTENLLPKFLQMASQNPTESKSGLSALATASSLIEQDWFKHQKNGLKSPNCLDIDKLSQFNVESLEAILRSKSLGGKLSDGSLSSSPIEQRSQSNSPNVASSGGNQTAVISLQASHSDAGATATALLASEDLQQLLSNSTNSQHHFYLLVPSDAPVLVPPNNNSVSAISNNATSDVVPISVGNAFKTPDGVNVPVQQPQAPQAQQQWNQSAAAAAAEAVRRKTSGLFVQDVAMLEEQQKQQLIQQHSAFLAAHQNNQNAAGNKQSALNSAAHLAATLNNANAVLYGSSPMESKNVNSNIQNSLSSLMGESAAAGGSFHAAQKMATGANANGVQPTQQTNSYAIPGVANMRPGGMHAPSRRISCIGNEHERPMNGYAGGGDLLSNETRSIRRRESHNEVERRRRDRINTWIGELQKLLPPDEQARSHTYQSKGLILKRVWEYFQNVDKLLKAANTAVQEIREENLLLRSRVTQLDQENNLLRNVTNIRLGQPLSVGQQQQQHMHKQQSDSLAQQSSATLVIDSSTLNAETAQALLDAAAGRRSVMDPGDQVVKSLAHTYPEFSRYIAQQMQSKCSSPPEATSAISEATGLGPNPEQMFMMSESGSSTINERRAPNNSNGQSSLFHPTSSDERAIKKRRFSSIDMPS